MRLQKMNMDFIENGGVTSPLGFQAAGVCAGLKRSHAPDMAMIWSEAPCSFSGTFTSNLFPAAPGAKGDTGQRRFAGFFVLLP